MNKSIGSGAVRRMGLAAALLIVGSSAALAFGVFPGSWKVVDGGKAIRKPPGIQRVALIQNNGPDSVVVSSKGTLVTFKDEILAGEKLGVQMPLGAKNVKLVDGNFNSGNGAKGSLMWAKKLPKTGGWGGGGSGGD